MFACVVGGCVKQVAVKSRRMCRAHYKRWYQHGDPTVVRKVSFRNLKGQRFTRLVAVRRADNRGDKVRWECQCDCGNLHVVDSLHLLNGKTKSCGCLHDTFNLKHGHTRAGFHSSVYQRWAQMVSRCTNAKDRSYHRYGGRGITVCDRWLSDFSAFLADVGEPPAGTSLDRIDNNGNYEPGNVRWATRIEQNNNTSRNRVLEYDGQRKTASEWARHFGLSQRLVMSRLSAGWAIDDVFLADTTRRSRKTKGKLEQVKSIFEYRLEKSVEIARKRKAQ